MNTEISEILCEKYGYKYGNYYGKCSRCDTLMFDVQKHCKICKDCAYELYIKDLKNEIDMNKNYQKLKILVVCNTKEILIEKYNQIRKELGNIDTSKLRFDTFEIYTRAITYKGVIASCSIRGYKADQIWINKDSYVNRFDSLCGILQFSELLPDERVKFFKSF